MRAGYHGSASGATDHQAAFCLGERPATALWVHHRSQGAAWVTDGEGRGAGKYDDLSQERLIALLEKRDREKKLGLVWERDEIVPDSRKAETAFVAATPVPTLHERAAPWRNLVIEGDNYDALRWLRMTYAGRIKCIYVDPPYNTGNKDWVYNDRYFSNEDRWRHSTWLEFLYERFSLARDLLTQDGVLLVSINDENRAKLELLLDEVMPGMRVGSLVWRTRVGGNEGGQAFLSDNHEHILVYGNPRFRFGGTEKSYDMYKYIDDEGQSYRISDMTVAVAFDDKRAGNGYYPLHDPTTDIYYPANPDRVWAFTQKAKGGPAARLKIKTIEEWIALGRIAFPENPRTVLYSTREELTEAIASRNVPLSNGQPMIREGLPASTSGSAAASVTELLVSNVTRRTCAAPLSRFPHGSSQKAKLTHKWTELKPSYRAQTTQVRAR
jgi:adenine-specific DNA-methyltransferase